MYLTNGKPAPQFKYARLERVTSNGKYYRHSLSIEIPDSGDSLTEVLPNHGDAVWTSSTPDEDGKYPIFDTYTTKGRTFETNERLYVTVNKKAWYGRGSFRIVLLREGDASEDGIRLALEPVEDQSEGTTMLLTTTIPQQDYTGSAFEGIGLLPFLADKLSFLLKPLFGFSSGEAVAVPVTALGSAGAALGLIPGFAKRGLINVGDLAVFVAICMCWSGYLSTHVSMMEVLGCREHTGKAILSHTVGGLCAGVAAHWLFQLFMLL